MTKLAKSSVAAIKAELAIGKKTKAQLARDYGVSRGLIWNISEGLAHADVPTPDVKFVADATPPTPIDLTDERILELETEIQMLREDLTNQKKINKAQRRSNGLFRALVDEMQDRVVPFKALPVAYHPTTTKKIKEHLVMHLSDGHHDEVVDPEECNNLEEHNFQVSCRRAENYVETTLDHTLNHLDKYDFEELTILAYGDHTSGEIHKSVDRSEYRNQFKNCLAIGQLHALMYRDLVPHFKRTTIVYVPGNHGRRSEKKDHHGAHDNWDYLIAKVAQMHTRDIENVEYVIPNAFSVNLQINGVGFNVSHGDDIKGSSGIPFYNLTRRQKSLLALCSMTGEFPIRYSAIGHHHVIGSLADYKGEALLNGAWVGTNAYSLNSFTGYREPSQLIHGVNPKHGVTWRMHVHLRSEDDVQGPKRYKVSI